MTSREVEVHSGESVEPRLVGHLRPSFTGGRSLASSSFQYASSWLDYPGSYAISPELPLSLQRTFAPENSTLFGAIADAAPDEWGRKIIDAAANRRRDGRDGPTGALGEFDYLLGVSDHTRMGALRFRDASGGEWLTTDDEVVNIHDLDRVLAAAARYEADEASDADIEYLSEVATSPGGARPKANVVLESGGLAIAKLPHSKDRGVDVEAWEAVVLDRAREAGIVVPAFDLQRASPRTSVLVSHRFDRRPDGRRRAYMSGSTVLGLGEHDGRTLSYADFADAVGELSSDPRSDLRELFARVCLTVLVNNTDDHWRNHGFLRRDSGWRLSPMFDVNPNPRRGGMSARALAPGGDPRERDIRDLFAQASVYGLTDEAAKTIVRRVAESVRAWPSAARSRGIADPQFQTMAPAFSERQLDFAFGL